MILLTILVFLLMLSVLVLIHEAGHFFVAKRLGIKVEEFGFGFPPKAFGIKRGETVYSINWLPIGGFVKLYGEDAVGGGKLSLPVSSSKYKVSGKEEILNTEYLIHDTDVKRAFFARPVRQRAAVVLAGVIMNTILAIVIFYAYLMLVNFKTSIPLIPGTKPVLLLVDKSVQTGNVILVDQVSMDSPAAKAGMTASEHAPIQIIAVNGKKITSSFSFLSLVQQNKGKPIVITWQEMSQKTHTATVIPRLSPPKGEGSLGVRFGQTDVPMLTLSYTTPVQKLFSGVIHPFNVMSYSLDAIGKLVALSFQTKNVAPVSQGVSGPVGIGTVVNSELNLPTLKERVTGLLNLAGLLSISLAFFNVLPIPALDGGRLFFILIEGVTRKKVNPKYEGYAHAVGFVVLMALVALVSFHDILKLIRP